MHVAIMLVLLYYWNRNPGGTCQTLAWKMMLDIFQHEQYRRGLRWLVWASSIHWQYDGKKYNDEIDLKYTSELVCCVVTLSPTNTWDYHRRVSQNPRPDPLSRRHPQLCPNHPRAILQYEALDAGQRPQYARYPHARKTFVAEV